jgi:hypothetical protein
MKNGPHHHYFHYIFITTIMITSLPLLLSPVTTPQGDLPWEMVSEDMLSGFVSESASSQQGLALVGKQIHIPGSAVLRALS